MSVDGMGAYDLISRQTVLSALRDLDGGGEIMPFVSSSHVVQFGHEALVAVARQFSFIIPLW